MKGLLFAYLKRDLEFSFQAKTSRGPISTHQSFLVYVKNLSGKTGWGMRDDMNNGWFVGYVESKGAVYFFATNVEKAETNIEEFPIIRIGATKEAFKVLGLIR